MTKQVQRRRGSASQHTSFTGAEGELSVNTTNKSVHVHDGSTAGGIEAARADLDNVSTADIASGISGGTVGSLTITSADVNGGTIDGTTIGGSSAAAGTFTTGQFNTSLNVDGTVTADGLEIEADVKPIITLKGSGNDAGGTNFGEIQFFNKDTSGDGPNVAASIHAESDSSVGSGGELIFSTETVSSEGEGNPPTKRMSIDSQGDISFYEDTGTTAKFFWDASAESLGIGTTTSPSATLDVEGSSNSTYLIVGGDDSSNGRALTFTSSASASFNGAVHTINAPSSQGVIALSTYNTERLRIDSSGNVGIGTSSPASYYANRLVVTAGYADGITVAANTTTDINYFMFADAVSAVGQGFIGYNHGTNSMNFGSNSTERMTIDSSGNVGIGTSSPTGVPTTTLHINGTTNAGIHITDSASGATDSDGVYFSMDNPNLYIQNKEAGFTAFETNATERMRIASGGQLFLFNQTSGAGNATLKYTTGTGAVTYDTSSRLVKENIVDCPYGLAEIVQLQPRKYFRIDDQANEVGLIADEVQSIMPEFVPTGEKSLITGVEEDTEIIALGVNYDKMVAPLVQAIKDLNAKIETLEEKVAALENA